jgi:hypothetical protein
VAQPWWFRDEPDGLAGWSSLAMIRTYVQARADVIAADEFKRLMA